MAHTISNAAPAAARSLASTGEVAVIAPAPCGDHALEVTDPFGPDGVTPIGLELDPNRLLERFGPVLGVGDAIWRAVAIVSAEIICVDVDRPLEPSHITRLAQPLIEHPGLMLVSGVEAPLPARAAPGAGDRLTELVARPLVARYEPALSWLRQPLLRSFAARRSLLRTVPFPVGAGVRLSLLVDAILRHGRDGVAEVVLGRPTPDERPLRELGADAAELIVALHRRSVTSPAVAAEHLMQPWNDLSRTALATDERPPLEGILAGNESRAPRIAPTPSGALSSSGTRPETPRTCDGRPPPRPRSG